MIQSARARRMRKRNARKGRVAPMNMISLMDIFTILVFFLLINSSAVETVPSQKTLTLPEAFEEQIPRETVTVVVTRDSILVQGEAVARLGNIADDSQTIPALRAALDKIPTQLLQAANPDGDGPTQTRGEVTILADKGTPYQMIRKVMQTCSEAKFFSISLAVMQKTETETAGERS